MKLIVRLIVLAGLVALGVWIWGLLFPSPQKVIEDHLLKLARLASFSSKDSNFKRLADNERIGSLLAPNIHVVLDLPGFRREEDDSRGELLQAVLAARSTVKDVQAQFTDIGISLSPDRQTAEALLTLRAKIGTEPDWVVQELRFRFRNTNQDWLIAGLESVKMLR